MADGVPAAAVRPRAQPVEPVWSHLERSLADPTKHALAVLTALVKTRLKRMQYRAALLAGLLASTGLEYGPLLKNSPSTIVGLMPVDDESPDGAAAMESCNPHAVGIRHRDPSLLLP
jgi:hypothetical protein